MKIKLVTLSALGALALANSLLAQAPDGGSEKRDGGRRHHRSPLERTTERLDLTAQQKAQVQPIIDQASPQIENIRREAMQKTKAVMDDAIGKIRPLLTPEQQKKLDDAQNDRRGGREKRRGRGDRRGDHGKGAEDNGDNGPAL